MNMTPNLWRLLFEHDPNGLLVLDEQMKIRLVNPALTTMLKTPAEQLMGRASVEVLGEVREFKQVFEEKLEVAVREQSFPQFDLFVRLVIFPVPGERIVAAIFVDMTREWKQRRELEELKNKTIQEVRQVVDKQMRVAQEIAGLLGETTAETKVSLLRVVETLRRDNHSV